MKTPEIIAQHKNISFNAIFSQFIADMAIKNLIGDDLKGGLTTNSLQDNFNTYLDDLSQRLSMPGDRTKLMRSIIDEYMEVRGIKEVVKDYSKADDAEKARIAGLTDDEYKNEIASYYADAFFNYDKKSNDPIDTKITDLLEDASRRVQKIQNKNLAVYKKRSKIQHSDAEIGALTVRDASTLVDVEMTNFLDKAKFALNFVSSVVGYAFMGIPVVSALGALAVGSVTAAVGLGLGALGFGLTSAAMLINASTDKEKNRVGLFDSMIGLRRTENNWKAVHPNERTHHFKPFSVASDSGLAAAKTERAELEATRDTKDRELGTARPFKRQHAEKGFFNKRLKRLNTVIAFVGVAGTVAGFYGTLLSAPAVVGVSTAILALSAPTGIGLAVGVGVIAIGLGAYAAYKYRQIDEKRREFATRQYNFSVQEDIYRADIELNKLGKGKQKAVVAGAGPRSTVKRPPRVVVQPAPVAPVVAPGGAAAPAAGAPAPAAAASTWLPSWFRKKNGDPAAVLPVLPVPPVPPVPAPPTKNQKAPLLVPGSSQVPGINVGASSSGASSSSGYSASPPAFGPPPAGAPPAPPASGASSSSASSAPPVPPPASSKPKP